MCLYTLFTIGFSTPDVTVNNGIRSSTSEGFLMPQLKKSSNLRLLLGAMVTKVRRGVGLTGQFNWLKGLNKKQNNE